MAKRKQGKPPANATAWCDLHERLMNDIYIRRRGCAMRRCKHLNWLEGTGPPDEYRTRNHGAETNRQKPGNGSK